VKIDNDSAHVEQVRIKVHQLGIILLIYTNHLFSLGNLYVFADNTAIVESNLNFETLRYLKNYGSYRVS